jgi:photosystem II stability/assembly factor-like uncharacterized protein
MKTRRSQWASASATTATGAFLFVLTGLISLTTRAVLVESLATEAAQEAPPKRTDQRPSRPTRPVPTPDDPLAETVADSPPAHDSAPAAAAAPRPALRWPDAVSTNVYNTNRVRDFLDYFVGVTEYGKTVTAAVVDDGRVYRKHIEFQDSDPPRVSFDTVNQFFGNHATEVASVLAAGGNNPDRPTARGVAPKLSLVSLTFVDQDYRARLAEQAKTTPVSSHSYVARGGWILINGEWVWYGDERLSKVEDAHFGKYLEADREIDRLLADHPDHLAFVAAGNARDPGRKPPPGVKHRFFRFVEADKNWEEVYDATTVRHPNDFHQGGLDTLIGLGVAKNVICVWSTGPRFGLAEPLRMTSFSSWGPTDDGRIKPDLVAIGDSVEAAQSDSPTAYRVVDGTSLSTPTAAGIGALLVELYQKESGGRRPTAAEIKAALIHTAEPAGAPGPDPVFGWGVINALEAGRVLVGARDWRTTARVERDEPREYTFTRRFDAFRQWRTPRVTLVWTDPPTDANACGLNDPTPTLVNDLDLVLVAPDGTTLYPYSLDPAAPLAPARTDRANHADNVEMVEITDVPEFWRTRFDGTWKVRVKPSSPLKSGQDFALIVSGLDADGERPRTARPPATAAAPARHRWRYLGPSDLGGPTWSLVIDPRKPIDSRKPHTMWAGCLSGGVWQTDDGGLSWTMVTGRHSSVPVSSLALDPSGPGTLYAGTGDASPLGYPRHRSGVGILKSVDGGANWSLLAATANPRFRYVRRLALSPDGKTLLAATTDGLFRSTDGGERFVPVTGIPAESSIGDLEFHPKDSSRCVAGDYSCGIFASVDGGASWQRSQMWLVKDVMPLDPPADLRLQDPQHSGRVAVAYARADPSVVYASIDISFEGYVLRSQDGGHNFTRRYPSVKVHRDFDEWGYDVLGNGGWYSNVIWAGDPQDPLLVVVGGFELYRSEDGGAKLQPIERWFDFTYGSITRPVYFQAIVASPDEKGVVFLASETGVYRVDNIRQIKDGKGIEARNSGYSATELVAGAGDARDGRMIAGSYCNGTLHYTPRDPAVGPTLGWISRTVEPAGENWLSMRRAGRCGVRLNAMPGSFYGERPYLQLYETSWTWTGLPSSRDEPLRERMADVGRWDRANPIAPFLFDPNDRATLLAGGTQLWRLRDMPRSNGADDRKSGWKAIKPDHGAPISAIAIATGQEGSNLIWVGHNDGRLYKTRNGSEDAPSWSRVDLGRRQPQSRSGSQPLPGRYCNWIAIDPAEHQTVYVLFGGYAPGNVWKTTDGGSTWRSIGPSLPQIPALTLAIHPERRDELYLGTDSGLWMSTDGGESWSQEENGPAHVAVSELFWMGKTLVAATLRGMYSLDTTDRAP